MYLLSCFYRFYHRFNTSILRPVHLSLCCIRQFLLKCNFIIIKRNPRVSDCTLAGAVFNFSLHLRLMEGQQWFLRRMRRSNVGHCLASSCVTLQPPGRALAPLPAACCLRSSSIHSNHSKLLLITFLTGFLWSFCFCSFSSCRRLRVVSFSLYFVCFAARLSGARCQVPAAWAIATPTPDNRLSASGPLGTPSTI